MLKVNMSMVSLEEVERSLLEREPSIALGGYWKPKDCLPRWKVSAGETLLGASRRGEYTRWTGVGHGGRVVSVSLSCRGAHQGDGSTSAAPCAFFPPTAALQMHAAGV